MRTLAGTYLPEARAVGEGKGARGRGSDRSQCIGAVGRYNSRRKDEGRGRQKIAKCDKEGGGLPQQGLKFMSESTSGGRTTQIGD